MSQIIGNDTNNDIDVIGVFAALLEIALRDKGVDVPVVQLDQPSQQARGESGVFFSLYFDERVGWAQTDIKYDEVADNFVFMEEQHMVGYIQVSVLYPAKPGNDARITAKDLANHLAQRMASSNYRLFLRRAGFGILPISHIRQEPKENDRGQYEFMPSFDMKLTYSRHLHQTVPRIVEIIGDIVRV